MKSWWWQTLKSNLNNNKDFTSYFKELALNFNEYLKSKINMDRQYF